MIPFQRILLPTDFSENAKAAQDYACGLADQFDAQLHVVNVVQDVALVLPETGMFLTLPLPSVHEIVETAETTLKTVLKPEWVNQHNVVYKVRVGTPFLAIVQYSLDQQMDLIVMGTHGRTGLQHVMLGSVAERVLRKSTCPVLTVRSPVSE